MSGPPQELNIMQLPAVETQVCAVLHGTLACYVLTLLLVVDYQVIPATLQQQQQLLQRTHAIRKPLQKMLSLPAQYSRQHRHPGHYREGQLPDLLPSPELERV